MPPGAPYLAARVGICVSAGACPGSTWRAGYVKHEAQKAGFGAEWDDPWKVWFGMIRAGIFVYIIYIYIYAYDVYISLYLYDVYISLYFCMHISCTSHALAH